MRRQLLNYIQDRHAHASFDEAIKAFPVKLINAKPEKIPYTFWALLEHIRISQNDILDFIQNPDYQDKDWPKDYWPSKKAKANKKIWDKTIAGYKKDLKALEKMFGNPKTDLLAKIPHGQGQTIFREALLVIDHNAYHIGEFILMRRALNIWK